MPAYSLEKEELTIIADDLTGACDTGIQFIACTGKVQVLLNHQVIKDVIPTTICSINTHTRESSSELAYKMVLETAAHLQARANNTTPIIFKKIDTMLRGNIGSGVDALLDSVELQMALIAPANPIMNRATIDGTQLWEGQPVNSKEYTENRSASCSHLPTLLSKTSSYPIDHIDLDTVRSGRIDAWLEGVAQSEKKLVVVDAENEEDLDRLITSSLNLNYQILYVGSIGLAKALAKKFCKPPKNFSNPRPNICTEEILLVSGSFHPKTLTQIRKLSESKPVSVVWLDSDEILNTIDDSTAWIKIKTDEAFKKLKKSSPLLLALLRPTDLQKLTPSEGKLILNKLVTLATKVIEENEIKALIITGGETAYQLGKCLKGKGIYLHAEIETGIPYGTLFGGPHKLKIITKGGSVGTPEALIKSVEYLTNGKEHSYD